jgi:hypothetical protein
VSESACPCISDWRSAPCQQLADGGQHGGIAAGIRGFAELPRACVPPEHRATPVQLQQLLQTEAITAITSSLLINNSSKRIQACILLRCGIILKLQFSDIWYGIQPDQLKKQGVLGQINSIQIQVNLAKRRINVVRYLYLQSIFLIKNCTKQEKYMKYHEVCVFGLPYLPKRWNSFIWSDSIKSRYSPGHTYRKLSPL